MHIHVPDIDVPIFDYAWDFILKNHKKWQNSVYLCIWFYGISFTRIIEAAKLDACFQIYWISLSRITETAKLVSYRWEKRHAIINMCLSWIFLETYDQAPVLCLFQAAVHKRLHPADPVNIIQQDACTYNYIYNHRKWSI